MKRKSTLLFLSLCALSTYALTDITPQDAERMSQTVSYSETSIHDPSVVFNPSDGKYYIIGSHRGFANTKDLVNLNTASSDNIYSSGYASEFKSSPSHTVNVTRDGVTTTGVLASTDAAAYCSTYAGITVGTRKPTTEAGWLAGNQWAPDMIYNPNLNKWCMYLSLNGDYWASVIVLLTADSPEGPFTYQAPIVFGGFNGQTYSGKSVSYKDTDLELVLGEQASLPSRYKTSAWGNLWPNCIDPCVFFDDDNTLWMAYGSWSGGIFMLKLDKNTGLRDYTYTYEPVTYTGRAPNGASYTGYLSDPYFGKLIAGGAYVSGEGAYIQKIGDFYYLFVTYGGLEPDGGYEMRVFRSDKPDGDYTDASGNNARYTQYLLNFGPSARTDKGDKLLGAMNNWGAMNIGECAEGHNSAIVDNDGDAFVVYHTKFNNGTQGFRTRVRQLFVNSKGRLVASPFRYTGKQTRQHDIENSRLFSPEELAGTYSLLIHPYRLNHKALAEATPVKVTLNADGTIEGDKTGTWQYTEDGKSFVDITIGGTVYHGVALRQNVDSYADMPAVCLSAMSDGGVPVWLFKYTPKAAVAAAYSRIVNGYLGSPSDMIKTDAPAVDNVDISFDTRNASSGEPEPTTLSPDGKYTPTDDGHSVTIYVDLRCGDFHIKAGPFTRPTMSKDFVPVPSDCYPSSATHDLSAAWWKNFSKDDYVLEQDNVINFHFYNYSDAAENWHNWALYGASTTRSAAGYKEYFGVRCDNWDNTTMSNTGCSSNYNWDTFKDDMNGSKVDMTVKYSQYGVFSMEADILTADNKSYHYSYTKTISGAPRSITLFFVNEKSYIDGSSLSGLESLTAPQTGGKSYNLQGIEVDGSYHGIVIRNGRKYVQ